MSSELTKRKISLHLYLWEKLTNCCVPRFDVDSKSHRIFFFWVMEGSMGSKGGGSWWVLISPEEGYLYIFICGKSWQIVVFPDLMSIQRAIGYFSSGWWKGLWGVRGVAHDEFWSHQKKDIFISLSVGKVDTFVVFPDLMSIQRAIGYFSFGWWKGRWDVRGVAQNVRGVAHDEFWSHQRKDYLYNFWISKSKIHIYQVRTINALFMNQLFYTQHWSLASIPLPQ